MRLLCIAAQGDPYGHVTIAGKAPSTATLAKLVRCKAGTVDRLIAELERRGVAKRDACGCLVSSRMESDGKLARIRAGAAKSRWKADHSEDLHMQNPGFASTEAESHQPTNNKQESPPTPRKRGANGASDGEKRRGRKEREPLNHFIAKATSIIEERDVVVPMARITKR
jgi:hypothetical protein